MPELPEVETMRRGIAAAAGSTIVRVWSPPGRLQPLDIRPSLPCFSRRVAGRSIQAIDRLGKRLLLRLSSGDSIVIEPRMTGRVLVAHPPNSEHLRVVFELQGGAVEQLLFWDMRGLGVMSLLDTEQAAQVLGPKRLGPDALAIGPDELRQRLGTSRRAVKVALMDQKAVLGIGNIYASEILHRASIHPECPCADLGPRHWARLHATMVEVLDEAVRHQGSTLRDGNYRTAAGEAGGYQHLHRVYQRHGQPCSACGTTIVRLVLGQRSTFFCPRCQRRRVLRKS